MRFSTTDRGIGSIAERIWVFLELFLVMPFSYITSFDIMSSMMYYLLFGVLFIELIIFVMAYKNALVDHMRYIIDKTEFFMLSFVIYQWGVSIWRGSLSVFQASVFPCRVVLVFLLFARKRQSLYLLLQTTASFFFLAILINFVALVLKPDGFGKVYASSGGIHTLYFISIDNQFGRFFFPGLTIIWFNETIRDRNRRNTITSVTTLIIILATYLATMSAAGLIAALVYALLYLIYQFGLFKKLLSIRVFFIVLVLLSVALLLGANFLYNNNAVTYFITAITGKDMSFSNRVFVWAEGIRMFLKNWLFGYGKSIDNGIVVWRNRTLTAHNTILHILLESGVIGLGLFIFMLYNAAKKSCLIEKKHFEVRILYIGFFSTSVYYTMEVGSMIPLFLVLLTMSVYPDIVNRNIYLTKGEPMI